MKKNNSIITFSLILIFVMLACNLPGTHCKSDSRTYPCHRHRDCLWCLLLPLQRIWLLRR